MLGDEGGYSSAHDDPASHAELADSLSVAMLIVLENLSPEQRAVPLLHDVFDYGYSEVAAIVGKTEATYAYSRRAPGATSSSASPVFRRHAFGASWQPGSSRLPTRPTGASRDHPD
jgi:hypothetical protein